MILPIIIPSPIIIPIEAKVVPKPADIVSTVSVGVIPPSIPVTTDAIKRATNTWIRVFKTRKIRSEIPISKPTIIWVVDTSAIYLSSNKKRLHSM